MVRLYALGRGLPAFSREMYHDALLNQHAPLVVRCAAFQRWCHHYEQNHVQGAVTDASAPLCVGAARFDNCSEFWFDDVAAIISTFNDSSYLEGVRPDEKNWTDASSRTAFVAQEALDLALGDGTARIKLLSLFTTGQPQAMLSVAGDEHCVRRSENPVLGVLDFPRSCMDESIAPPFAHVSERWFESADSLRHWLDAQNADFSFSTGLHLWADLRVLY